MYSKQNIDSDINKIGIKPDDALLIHSSMRAIGEVAGGADTVIDAFIDCLSKGLLIFPTLSHKSVSTSNPVFDPQKTRSDVGILTNIFMKRPNVLRSIHPTHSVAAIGNIAKEFIKGEENSTTPCPKSGCWGKLYDYDAKIMFLGCSLTRNTFLHSVEEWLDIPNRLTKDYDMLKAKMPNGEIVDHPMKRHDGNVRSWENYDKIESEMINKGIAIEAKIGNARTVVCDARKMADFVVEILKKNPNYFADRD